jgi:hypothetical protein
MKDIEWVSKIDTVYCGSEQTNFDSDLAGVSKTFDSMFDAVAQHQAI